MTSEPIRDERAVGEAQPQTPASGHEPNGAGHDNPGDTGQVDPSAGNLASQMDERTERGEEGGPPDDPDATDDDDDDDEADNVEYMPRPPADS